MNTWYYRTLEETILDTMRILDTQLWEGSEVLCARVLSFAFTRECNGCLTRPWRSRHFARPFGTLGGTSHRFVEHKRSYGSARSSKSRWAQVCASLIGAGRDSKRQQSATHKKNSMTFTEPSAQHLRGSSERSSWRFNRKCISNGRNSLGYSGA